MPANPDDGARLAARVLDVLAAAERALIAIIVEALRRGIAGDTWEQAKLAELQLVCRRLLAGVQRLDRPLADQITRIVLDAYNTGQALASADLHDAGRALELAPDPIGSAGTWAASAVDSARSALYAVPDLLMSVYHDTVAAGAAELLGGSVTRIQAAQNVLDDLASRGITGFRDRAGRTWALESYVEMAVRTSAGHAAVQGHVDALAQSGLDLVIVSDAPRECPLCRPWERKVLSITGRVGALIEPSARTGNPVTVNVTASLADARAAGFQHPNCFPGGAAVTSPSGVRAADARWYEGELVVIHTASGNELPVTPNHPVLTPEGWVAAGALQVGQSVLRHDVGINTNGVVGPDEQQVPTAISEVFHALRQASSVLPVRMPATPEQFHGDGGVDSDVEIVFTDGFLENDRLSAEAAQSTCDHTLLLGRVGLADLLSGRALDQVGIDAGHASDGVMSRGREGESLFRSHAGVTALHSFAATDLSPTADDPAAYGGLSDAEDGRQLALSLADQVTLDEIIDIGVRQHAAHVYNLESGDGWYVAESIVVHNCRHSIAAYLPGVTLKGVATADPARYEAGQRQREIERKIREWKRRKEVALDDAAARKAATKIRNWQAVMREHIDQNDLTRLRKREQIGTAI